MNKGRSPFIKLIKALESDHNPDVVHRQITSGIHEGDRAIGAAGLMPNTVREMANRRKISGINDVSDDLILSSDNPTISSMLMGNPDLRMRYVEDMADKVLDKTQGDVDLAATAWLYGHNMDNKRLQEKLANDPQYQQRINTKINEQNLMSESPTFSIPSLEDSLQRERRVDPMSKIKRLLNPKK